MSVDRNPSAGTVSLSHATRLLRGRSNRGRAADRQFAIDQFAAALADGLTVAQASVRVRCSESAGRNYLIAIRRGLGPQAI